ncbi:MAG: NAD kinase, partial [Nocardioides sp.]
MTPTPETEQRRVLVLAHTGRADARDVARAFCKALTGHGMVVRLLAAEARDLDVDLEEFDPPIEIADAEGDAGHECELALVIGGDGTI